MSDQFYNYLADKVISYLNNRVLKSGDKFNIQFEEKYQVDSFYKAIEEEGVTEKFRYEITRDDVYETYNLNIGGIKVIVAATVDNITPDFMIRLRNIVGEENDELFGNAAILFIHDTSLDSIVRGTESLQKEGMPFHNKIVVRDIKKQLLYNDRLKQSDKYVLNFVLERMNEDIFEDNSSIFQYKDILRVLNQGYLGSNEYANFGLFNDSNLHELPKTLVKKRLKENADFFEMIDIMHKYADPAIELEKYFDKKGVKKLKEDQKWKKVDYKEVKQSKEEHDKITPIMFKKINIIQDMVFWEKAQGNTKAAQRKRNIIIFNEKNLDEIHLEIIFDGDIKSEYIKADDLFAEKSGKKIKTIIRPKHEEPCIARVRYDEDKNKHEFKIAVVGCSEAVLKDIKTSYSVSYKKTKDQFIVVSNDKEQVAINPGKAEKIKEYVKDIKNSMDVDENQSVDLIFDVKMDEDSRYILVDINYNGNIISLAKEEDYERPTVLTGSKVLQLKMDKKENFELIDDNKIVQGTSEYFAREDFRKNIEFENKIIEDGGLYYRLIGNEIERLEIDINKELEDSYKKIIEYYRKNNLIPSLAYYDDELLILVKEYLDKFIEILDDIKDEEVLSKQQRDLVKIGRVDKSDGDKEIMLTPLNPLNMAYQLLLNDEIDGCEVGESILKTLNSKYMAPYIYDEEKNLYKIADQNHSPEWTYYVNHEMNRYKGSRDYVSKLTKEKIGEFISHFEYLFERNSSSTLKIKLINLGDCKEILTGIYDYYIGLLNEGVNIKDFLNIDVYIYGDKKTTNIFEEISFYDCVEDIKKYFGINIKSEKYSDEEIIDAFRKKIHFYKKDKNESEYEYSHLTFYELDQDTSTTSSSMEDIRTGVSMHGLMSGLPSVYLKDSYRTGFGSRFMVKDKNDLLKIAMKINPLIKSVGTGDAFNHCVNITTSVEEKNKHILDKIYDTSHWITFIDPKVDLNFFKNDLEFKDIFIIHYSDQYTSSSGYDAITVTRKSKQYKIIVEEFLKSKDIEIKKDTVANVINYFNAINGDWLLRLISSKSQFPREKLSILSAVKVSLSYLYHPDIIWIPVSLEEILRISGGSGLKQRDGLFTVKNLTGKNDSYSDDLLLIGVEEIEGNVKIHYYPVEVKIGVNGENIISKAVDQANKTRNLIEEFLVEKEDEENKFMKKIYRNFMMQLAIVSAEKMEMYNIWPEQEWNKITNSYIRTNLLNDEYEISRELDEYIGRGAVISFKKDVHFNSELEVKDNVHILELAEQKGYGNITLKLEDMKGKYIKGQSDFDVEKMLIRKYKSRTEYKKEVFVKEEKGSDKEKVDYTENTSKEHDFIKEKSNNDDRRPMQIIFGTERNTNQPLIWYPTDTEKVMNTNTGIIGTMGTGKTQFTKSLITQIYREQKYNIDGKPIGMLIFDYKGDYIDDEFVKATDAKVYEIFHLPYNPLGMLIPERPKPLLPLHTANQLKETISKAFRLGPKQDIMLRDAIMDAYEKKGVSRSNMETWKKSAPTISDMCSIYFNREEVKEDSLYAALKNLYEFEIFEPDSSKTKNLFDVVEGVTVINLSGYDEDIQNLVVAITLDIFYMQMQVMGESKHDKEHRQMNKLILVDEADNFLSKNFTSIKKILKEGRMFGVGTILSTQLLSHFSTSENEYQNYILTWIVHNVSDLNNKDIRYIFNTNSKSEDDNIYNKIKKLAKHESLVKMPKKDRPIYIRDKAFWELDKYE